MSAELEAVAAFVAERNQVLLTGDLNRLAAFHRKHNPGSPGFPNREVAEIALHKARTAAKALPTEVRMASKAWLMARGYESMDDDLPPPPSKGDT